MDPENLVLSLTRLRNFLVEMDVKELSLPVYDPNRGRLHPREFYALVSVILSDTNIQVYLLKYRLSDVREGVRLKTKLSEMCDMCGMLCYVLCY